MCLSSSAQQKFLLGMFAHSNFCVAYTIALRSPKWHDGTHFERILQTVSEFLKMFEFWRFKEAIEMLPLTFLLAQNI